MIARLIAISYTLSLLFLSAVSFTMYYWMAYESVLRGNMWSGTEFGSGLGLIAGVFGLNLHAHRLITQRGMAVTDNTEDK